VSGPVLLRHAARVPVPWKNGGGILWDVASHDDRPDEPDGFARFLWRVSIAEVARGGPFSVFPGVDRTLAVLSGRGMRLTVEGRPAAILSPDSPAVAFPGDVPTSADLPDGPILDLNLMVRRGEATGELRRQSLDRGMQADVGGAQVLLVASGGVLLRHGGATLGLGHLDAANLGGIAAAAIEATEPSTVWLAHVRRNTGS
jgi:hypothetical protein